MGLIEKNLKNYDEALKNFDRVLKLEPNNKAALKECVDIKKSFNRMEIKNTTKTNLINEIKSVDLNNEKKEIKRSTQNSSNKSSNTSFNTSSNRSSNESSNKSSSKKVENIHFPKINLPIKMPDVKPKTSYQFDLFWREIKDDQFKIDYLSFVGASHFVKIFQKNLEPDFMSQLIVLFQSMDKNLVLDFLNAIVLIDTFDFLLMFLSKKEKDILKQLIHSLDSDDVTINRLINLYKIK